MTQILTDIKPQRIGGPQKAPQKPLILGQLVIDKGNGESIEVVPAEILTKGDPNKEIVSVFDTLGYPQHLLKYLNQYLWEKGLLKPDLTGKIRIPLKTIKEAMPIVLAMADPMKHIIPGRSREEVLGGKPLPNAPEIAIGGIKQVKVNPEIPTEEKESNFIYPQGPVIAASYMIGEITGKNGPYPEVDGPQTEKQLELLVGDA